MIERTTTQTIPQDILDALGEIRTEAERKDLFFAVMSTLGLYYLEKMVFLERALERFTLLIDILDPETPTQRSIIDHNILKKASELMKATRLKYFDIALSIESRRSTNG